MVAPDPIQDTDVRTLLSQDEALVSYFVLDDRLLAWLIRPGQKGLTFHDIPVSSAELTTRVNSLLASVTLARSRSGNIDLKPVNIADAYWLYQKLFGPFENELTGVKNLIVVPDRQLLRIPFGALVTSTKTPSYELLLEDYNKGLSPSEKTLREVYSRIARLLDQPSTLCHFATRATSFDRITTNESSGVLHWDRSSNT